MPLDISESGVNIKSIEYIFNLYACTRVQLITMWKHG